MESSSTAASRTPSLSVRGRILLQSGVQAAGKAVSGLGALLLLALITRYLGKASFGTYTIIIAYISLFYVVTDLGSQSIAVRNMAREPQAAPTIAGQLLLLKVVTAVGAFAAALLIAWPRALHQPPTYIAVVLAAGALLAVPFSATGGAIFQTRLQMRIPALADTVSRLVTLAVVGLLVLTSSPGSPEERLVAVMAAATVGPLLGAGLTFGAARRAVPVRVRYDARVMRPLLKDAIPLAIVFVLSVVHYRVDVLILGLMKGVSTVGLYGVATRLLDVALAGSALFMGLAFPVLSRRIDDRDALVRAFRKAFDFMLMAGVAAAVFAWGLAPLLVRLLAGHQYSGAAVPVAIIAWAIPITLMNTVVAHMIVAANKQRAAVPVTLGAIVLNIVLNVALIPHLGAAAPALVTDISEGAGALGMGVVMVRHYRFAPSPLSVLRIVVSGAACAACLYALLPFGTLLAIPAAAAVYAVGLILTGAVSVADLRGLRPRPSI